MMHSKQIKLLLDIGDILISKDAIHHDVDATVFGYPLGELPQMGIREFIAISLFPLMM